MELKLQSKFIKQNQRINKVGKKKNHKNQDIRSIISKWPFFFIQLLPTFWTGCWYIRFYSLISRSDTFQFSSPVDLKALGLFHRCYYCLKMNKLLMKKRQLITLETKSSSHRMERLGNSCITACATLFPGPFKVKKLFSIYYLGYFGILQE